jgi:hypothetical protein
MRGANVGHHRRSSALREISASNKQTERRCGEVMLAGGKEEGPEPPACAVGVAEVALLPRGEDLGQVPGVFLRMVLAPHGHEEGVRVVPSLASISTWMFLTFEGVGLDQSFVTFGGDLRRERCFCRSRCFSFRWWRSRRHRIQAPWVMAALRTIHGRTRQVRPRIVVSIVIIVVMDGEWYLDMSSTWMAVTTVRSDMSCSVQAAYAEHSSVMAAVVVLSVLLLLPPRGI